MNLFTGERPLLLEMARGIDDRCNFHMPDVKCDRCKHSWGGWNIQYPGIDLPLFHEDKRFAKDSVVSMIEFKALQEKIAQSLGRPIYLPPGTGLGGTKGEAGFPLPEFVKGSCLFIAREALEILRRDGFSLEVGKAKLRRRGKQVDTHVPLQIEAVPLVAEEDLVAHYDNCNSCGRHFALKIVPTREQVYTIVRDRIPSDLPIVQDAVSCARLISPALLSAVKKHGFGGINGIAWGHFSTH